MQDKKHLLAIIPQQGVLPLYFYKDTDVSIEVLRALYRAGIRAVEYTNRGEAALQNFKMMRAVCDGELTGMCLGVGTIKNRTMAQMFMDAGADFIVSPGLVDEVAAAADSVGMLWVPGCMTPTEIIHAENLGAGMIKLFPGNILGPGFVSAIKELFPGLLFMPTGGVDLEEGNLSGWFKAGVCAVGMGSKLLSKNLLEQRNYAAIESLTRQVTEMITRVR